MDLLSPDNRLVFAACPLTGFALPSSGNLLFDRVYTLIRAFWVRELGEKWSNEVELPASKMV